MVLLGRAVQAQSRRTRAGGEGEQVAKATGRLILLSVELSYFVFLVVVGLLNCINCNPVPRGTKNHSHEALLNRRRSLRLTRGYRLNLADRAKRRLSDNPALAAYPAVLKRRNVRMTKSRRLLHDPRQFVELHFTPSTILWAFCRTNRGFEFQQRSQLFIRSANETLSVVAMCVCNPDRSPRQSKAETQPNSRRLS